MQNVQPATPYPGSAVRPYDSPRSAVSWAAVIAGAVIAAALSAMLIMGGSGLGFLAMSPWQQEGASGATLAIGSVIWLLVTQIIAYGIAGYVAGRLRTKWTDAAADEIYFRDTAHGFLVWALSAVVGFVLVASSVSSVVSGTAKAGANLAGAGAGAATAVAGAAAQNSEGDFSLDYFTDALLRPDNPSTATTEGDARSELSRILAKSLAEGEISDEDRSYAAKLIAQRAGIDEAAAEQRLTQIEERAQKTIDDAEQTAREAADAARKAAAIFSLWAFASLLIGAFVASFAATMGGRARDR